MASFVKDSFGCNPNKQVFASVSRLAHINFIRGLVLVLECLSPEKFATT